ncbi:MAG TPA: DUF1080 domain-containing protein [Verrucomicrobiota bacterium]|nr:DUF1080 domain-containing protein [Verrucomicrobiota bacterium]
MQVHGIFGRALRGLLCGSLVVGASLTALADDGFLGRWALTIPGGGAGWLGITKANGWYDASILWGGGSVVPVSSVFFSDDVLYVTRSRDVRRKDADGKVIRTQQFTDAIIATRDGSTLNLTLYSPREDGLGINESRFTGQRIPDLPPAPDLSKVKFGEPIRLFNGRDLAGWRLIESGAANGWSAKDGCLVNRPDKNSGKHYGNLRTDREFEDFNLTLEVNVPRSGNSGIYLRGIYEIQVADSYNKAPDSHGMGGLYSRITPSSNPAKAPGEWQTMDITLVDRHLTVILNGVTIINNQPVLGCTGGALWSDESRPGPLYLQGDHEAVDYRNMLLRPVLK